MPQLGQPIIVIGKHRSGTSAVTLALRELGLYLGPEQDIFKPDSFNEDGNLENIRISQMNQQLSAEFEADGTSTGSVPSNWKERPGFDLLIEAASKFLPKDFEGHSLWGWKDPRTTLLLPVYKEIFKRMGSRPHFVMPVRNPLEVAKSMARRDNVSQNVAVGLWIHYVLTALHDLEPGALTLLLYETFLLDPRGCLESCLADLEVEIAGGRWDAVRNAVRSDLNHNQTPVEEISGTEPAFLGKVYNLATAIANDRTGYRAGAYRDQIQRAWEEWKMLGEVRLAHLQRSIIRLWWPGKDGEAKSHMLVNQCDREWHAAQVPLQEFAPGYLHLGLVPQGSILYMRKPEFASNGNRITAVMSPVHGAYPETFVDGTVRLLTHGKDDHCVFAMPPVDGEYTFGFEYQVDATSRAARFTASLLSGEVQHLREQLAARQP